jgi:2-polyprenyl-3-methyl-5-hydroxy-6-metoxy-1,4-benzoquinol methylase
VVQAVGNYHDLIRMDVFPALPETLGRVLDLGGGVGATSGALRRAHRASYVVLADLVADQAVEGVDCRYSGDLEDEAFVRKVISEAGPFDTILALDILEHLRDPWSVVRLLHVGLAPKGVIVASVPNVNHYRLVLPLVLRGRYDLEDSGILDRTHLRWFARHGAVELMSQNGLEIELVLPNIIPGGRRYRWLNRVTFGLLTRFLALQYTIRARIVD